MEQGYLLDTNTVVYFLEGTLNQSGRKFILKAIRNGARISIVSKIELFAWNLPAGSNADNLKTLIDNAHVYPLDESVADKTIVLRKLHRKLKLPDAIIAATALCHGYNLITRNFSDFSIISELKTIDPFKK